MLMRKFLFFIISLTLLYCIVIVVLINSTITKIEKIQKNENIILLSDMAIEYNIKLRDYISDDKINDEYSFIENQQKYYTLLNLFESKIRRDLIISLFSITIFILAFFIFIIIALFSKTISPVEKILKSINYYVKNGVVEPIFINKNDLLIEDFNKLLLDLDSIRKYEKTEVAYNTTKKNASMLIHEIKNKLSPINLITGTLFKFGDESNKKDYKIILKNILGIENVLSCFKDIANLPKPVFKKVFIFKIISELKKTYSNYLKISITAKIEKLEIFSDPQLLDIIFTNLIKNAYEAGATEMTISYDEIKYTISFADNGCGVSEEITGNIFNPGFTTKQNGDGMGLFTVKHLINLLGYSVDYQNKSFIISINEVNNELF